MKKKILTREIVRKNGWDKLKTITPDMLNEYTSIGKCAFENCNSLTSITIPNSVTSIGDWAFSNCSSLISIVISNSVTSIGNSAFCYCLSLTSITIPNSVTSIGYYAFYSCKNLISITISNGVIYIGHGSFESCINLISIIIPNSVTYIGKCAFMCCRSKVEKRYDTQDRLIAYKGFNSNMTCRGFQYEEGKTYEMDGEIKLCERGFHACLNSLDCLTYYFGEIGKDVVYHEVYLEGVSNETYDDSKVVARKITIGREITLAEMADIASDRK